MIQTNHSTKGGFALLITLLTVGVIVSATLAIVELSRLQLQLSVDSKDAEVAFSAANAAKECAQYIRTTASSTISGGNPINANCFGQSITSVETRPLGFGVSGGSGGNVRRYQYSVQWDDAQVDRCSVVDMVVVYADTGDVTIGGSGSNSLKTVISNYRNDSMTCVRGSECTIIAAAGYNSSCNNYDLNSVDTLKREVLLEF